MKKLLLPLMTFFLASCVSQYHLGRHYLGNNQTLVSVVSEGTDKLAKPFEEKCIQYLAKDEIDSFKELFTNKLLEVVPKNSFSQMKEAIQNYYKPNGLYERIKLVNVSVRMDEATFKNGFDYYDYIEAEYVLHGDTDAMVNLQMTQVSGKIKLSGFALRAADPNKRGSMFSIQYSVPETIDKAGLSGRMIVVKPN